MFAFGCVILLGTTALAQSRNRVRVVDQGRLAKWVGEYESAESAPPNVIEEYLIYVCNTSGLAYISVDGHMTLVRLKARVQAVSNGVRFYFAGYGVGDMSPKQYKRSDLLLTLEKHGHRYRLHFGALPPQLYKNVKTLPAERHPPNCSPSGQPAKWQQR